jgi:galactose mutarotase-like enzyme
MQDHHSISNSYLSATIRSTGAELCSLRDSEGYELMWQAGPAWPRHAPLLFPIVGALLGQGLNLRGKRYPMGRHGFAREHRFAWAERSTTRCRLVLHDDGGTRAQYPFAFKLEQIFSLDDDALTVETIVTNTGRDVLPASLGQHPAFRWPLIDDVAKDAHSLTFAAPEPAPIWRLDADGLVSPGAVPSPITGTHLRLDPALFDADAIILPRPASTSLRYSAPDCPTIELSWSSYEQLGIWSKPGADFLCIEPWFGTASPEGWDGEFPQKPGLKLIPPGEKVQFQYHIRLL